MRGYPKHIATQRDYENLLNMPEHKARAMAELQEVFKKADEKAVIATTPVKPEDPQSAYLTKEVENPMPLWKIKGFKSRDDISALITKSGGEVK